MENYRLTDQEFGNIKKIVYEYAGINLTDVKRQLVITRLSKRLRELQLSSFTEYLNYINFKDPQKIEFTEMINRISTNLTYFFREEIHFEFCHQYVFPDIKDKIKIWCAAASTGEEPYSISISVLEYNKKNKKKLNAEILASDISTSVLQTAQKGIYTEEAISKISSEIKKTYFLKGYDTNEGLVAVKPVVKTNINFKNINVLHSVNNSEKFDLIFLRNILIYFDQKTKKDVINNMQNVLKKGGYLIMGVTDSVMSLTNEMKNCGNSIYKNI